MLKYLKELESNFLKMEFKIELKVQNDYVEY